MTFAAPYDDAGPRRRPAARLLRADGRAPALLRHRVEQQLRAAADLTYVQFKVLARLGLDSPTGSLRMTELADEVVYSRSGLTYQAGQMENAGLVERGPSPDDDRGVTVTHHRRRPRPAGPGAARTRRGAARAAVRTTERPGRHRPRRAAGAGPGPHACQPATVGHPTPSQRASHGHLSLMLPGGRGASGFHPCHDRESQRSGAPTAACPDSR